MSSAATMFLPKQELVVYAVVYVGCVIYGTGQLVWMSNDIYDSAKGHHFADGWSILGRKQDQGDDEWHMWLTLMPRTWMWFVTHVVVSEVTRGLGKDITKYLNLAIGMAFIFCSYGEAILVMVLFNVTIFLGLMTVGRRSVLWVFGIACIWLMQLNWFASFLKSIMSKTEEDGGRYYEMVLMLSWNQLKILSACLDLVGDQRQPGQEATDVLEVYCYMFYLPNMVSGPLLLFGRFTEMLRRRDILWPLRTRVIQLGVNLLRVLGWYLLMELVLHFAYVPSLMNDLKMVEGLNRCTLYAFGFVMGFLFHAKYSVLYGTAMALANFDGMDTPSLPRHISIVHRFTDMWKFFDTGLYEFLFRHIYTTLCERSSSLGRKAASSAVCFAFIFIWHGMFRYVLVWSLLNYVVVMLDSVFRAVRTAHQPLIDRYLSASNQARCAALLGSQLYILGALSNFVFFAGLGVGQVFFKRVYWTGDWMTYALLSGTSVCLYQTSEWVDRQRILLSLESKHHLH